MFNQNPEAVYNLARIMVKNWSAKWNNNVDKLLPNPEEVQRRQLQIAIQAVGMFVEINLRKSANTGLPPVFDPRMLLGMITQMQKEAVTPPTPEQVKHREEAVKNGSVAQ